MPQAVRDPGTGQQEIVGGVGLKSLSFTFLKSAMTDGGGTNGFIDFPQALPQGANVLAWSYNTIVAFTGDTSAVVQVGEAGALTRFSTTTTGSCFTAIKGSSATVIATQNCVAAVTPRVTITSATDFTPIPGTASMTVTIFYVDAQNP